MKGPDWCHVLIGKVGYADRKSFMSYIICRYVLPYRSECYKLLRLCVCVCVFERSTRGKDKACSTN